MPISSDWTDTTVAQLTEWWPKMSASRIVDAFFERGAVFTKNAIVGKAHRLGLCDKRAFQSSEVNGQRHRRKPVPRRAAPAQKKPPAAPQPAPAPFVPRVIARPTEPVHFDDLHDGMCKFECSGQEDVQLFRFCGHPAGEHPYCPAHCRIAYLGAPPQRRRAQVAA